MACGKVGYYEGKGLGLVPPAATETTAAGPSTSSILGTATDTSLVVEAEVG